MASMKIKFKELCKIIRLLYDIDSLKPIHLEFAKNDKTDKDTVSIFWNVLQKISTINHTASIVYNVKSYLASLNYRSLHFYCLPNDMSYGSRELLLALNWLIGEKDIFETTLKKYFLNHSISDEFISKYHESHPFENETENFEYFQSYYNYALWIIGEINLNKKDTAEMNEKTMELNASIHKSKYRMMINSSVLSVAELSHLKQPETMKAYLRDIKEYSEMLEYYCKWKVNDKHYWRHMIEVVLLKNDPNATLDMSNLKSFLTYLKTHLQQLLTHASENKSTQLRHNNFPRCSYIDNSATPQKLSRNLSKTNIKPLDNYPRFFKELNLQNETSLAKFHKIEKKNLEGIYDYLQEFIL